MERFQRFREGLMLIGIVMALFGGMSLAMAAGLFVGAKPAQAQLSGTAIFELCKRWETTGTPGSVEDFQFDVFDSSSEAAALLTIPGVIEGGATECIFVQAATGEILIVEQTDDALMFETPEWSSDNGQTRTVGHSANFVLSEIGCFPQGTQVGQFLAMEVPDGPAECTITYYNSDTLEPPPTSAIMICKEWPSNGFLSGSRTFLFDVSDNEQQRVIPINGVVEGGAQSCEPVTVRDGQVRVTEQVPAGFDEPTLDFGGDDQGFDNSITFFVSQGECSLRDPNSEQLIEAIVAASCILTFTNSDNDTATVTATPTFVVCPRCNTVTATVPPPTSTPTPPPATATQPLPTATQPPPTATPTSITGGTGGLTDAQRTQTAVAAARTAAAQQTPLPPRTGLGSDGAAGGGTGVNIALFAIGLVVLSGGLGLVAVRSRR